MKLVLVRTAGNWSTATMEDCTRVDKLIQTDIGNMITRFSKEIIEKINMVHNSIGSHQHVPSRQEEMSSGGKVLSSLVCSQWLPLFTLGHATLYNNNKHYRYRSMQPASHRRPPTTKLTLWKLFSASASVLKSCSSRQ